MTQDKIEEFNNPKNLVSFRSNDQLVTVDLESLNRAFKDVEIFNGHFSRAGMAMRLLFDDEEDNNVPSLAEEESNQQASAFFMDAAHKKVVNGIGLSLEYSASETGIVAYEGYSAGEGTVQINIDDKSRFNSFLKALHPQQLVSTKLNTTLERIPESVNYHIRTTYYPLDAPELQPSYFEGLENMIAEYKRLGMEKSVKELESYVFHHKVGDLKEYIAIGTRGLLSEPGKFFGPGDWQRDASPETVARKWNEALRILKMSRENSQAKELHEKLREHLTKCIEYALEDLKNLDYLSPEGKNEVEKVLKKTKLEIIYLN